MEDSLLKLLPSLPSAIISDLLTLGVCVRCVFRFLNMRSVDFAAAIPSCYLLISHLQASMLDSGAQMNGSAGTVPKVGTDSEPQCAVENSAHTIDGGIVEPCIVCLGILQVLDDNMYKESVSGTELQRYCYGAKQKIVEAAHKEGHEFDSFCLEVSLPAICVVRERALWYYLKQKYPEEALFSHNHETDHIVTLKEAVKWSLIAPLELLLGAKFDSNSLFRIALLYKHPESLAELDFLGGHVGGDAKRRRHGSVDSGPPAGLAAVAAARTAEAGESLTSVMRALATMSYDSFSRTFTWPPSKPITPCELATMCWRMPVFVGGRYLKYSRNISQSRWMIDDERMGEGSVQEVIGDVVFPPYKGDSYKFHAAGREDIDVRMLGPGRPFIVEISNARVIPSSAEIRKLERDINSLKEGWVKVRELRQVGIDACAIMREGESEKQKEYAAVVWLSRPVTEADFECLSSFKELELQQKTPVRVLHRRSPLTRPRTIHWMRCKEIKGTQNYFVLFLCTQAGTYIKEFVHGDLGRTFPNVGSILGCEADILQLDVMDVKMDFH
ncbi:unnamed protein product [Sphagnum troendelagicum]|uniref:tRNA pseudouridine(55) synthase n=1 Tax=Sphagnum troendelagicum TaxID=128251 RepID=A0ABP0TPN9_9BRYO